MNNKFAGDIQQVLSKYIYKSTTEGDVIGDTREKTLSGWIYTEMCTVAHATKGSGTWIVTEAKQTISLTDSNEGEGAGSYIDLTTSKSGLGEIVAGDGTIYAKFIFTVAGAVTLIYNSANVFTTLQTGTNHVIIKDNGDNVRIVNEMGATTTYTVTVNYTV